VATQDATNTEVVEPGRGVSSDKLANPFGAEYGRASGAALGEGMTPVGFFVSAPKVIPGVKFARGVAIAIGAFFLLMLFGWATTALAYKNSAALPPNFFGGLVMPTQEFEAVALIQTLGAAISLLVCIVAWLIVGFSARFSQRKLQTSLDKKLAHKTQVILFCVLIVALVLCAVVAVLSFVFDNRLYDALLRTYTEDEVAGADLIKLPISVTWMAFNLILQYIWGIVLAGIALGYSCKNYKRACQEMGTETEKK